MTYLDPLPGRFETGHTYTVGFWVLQHGTHPFEGVLDRVGLRLTRADGRSVTFEATPLPEAAHYATSLAVPRGEWKVEALQGWFPTYEVGVLKVPGDMRVAPVPAEMVGGRRTEERWGAIRPPKVVPGEVPVSAPAPPDALGQPPLPAKTQNDPASATNDDASGTGRTGTSGAAAAETVDDVAKAGAQSAATSTGIPAYTLLLAAAGGAALAAAALWRAARRRRQAPDPPADPAADTLAIP
ncbi:hypothetical protein ABZW11_06365 [Nonomuraea sp. NPDC004580]|uniref:hypothetical protein n=1 Tax=Nonomuraea sp. NPDC004580 TaxID=3154552 RepID=UPI0033B7CBB4